MRQFVFTIIFISVLFIALRGQESKKSFTFNIIDREIVVDGVLEKKEWQAIKPITGLLAPWSAIKNDQTVFKGFFTDACFYFSFEVTDKAITTYDFEEELTVAKEDRVELFFSAKPDLSQYFCIEIDPLGRVLDYSAQHYRKFCEDWDFKQVKVATKLTKNGYDVEGCILLSELKKIGISDYCYLGVFRADFLNKKSENAIVWYSWIDPENPTPDFHIPSAFVKCKFKE